MKYIILMILLAFLYKMLFYFSLNKPMQVQKKKHCNSHRLYLYIWQTKLLECVYACACACACVRAHCCETDRVTSGLKMLYLSSLTGARCYLSTAVGRLSLRASLTNRSPAWLLPPTPSSGCREREPGLRGALSSPSSFCSAAAAPAVAGPWTEEKFWPSGSSAGAAASPWSPPSTGLTCSLMAP